MSRRKEFDLGPEGARELYNYGVGEKRMNSEGRVLQTQGIGRQIGLGVYEREDVQRTRQRRSGVQHLFDPPPLAKPHEQSEEQFERDPRTWWHGEYTFSDAADIRRQTDAAGGIHMGTLKSAQDRLQQTGPGIFEPGTETPMPARLFAGRIHGKVTEALSEDAGDVWRPASSTRLYENLSEHRGSISAVVPGREHFKTHQELIHEHLMASKNPRAALEGLRPRVRAEFEAKGGQPQKGAPAASFDLPPEWGNPNVGRQFSHIESYEHPDVAKERGGQPEQLSMFNTVRIGSNEKYLTEAEYGDLQKMLNGPPLMMKPGKAKKAF